MSYAESDDDEDVVVSRKATRSRRTQSRPVIKDEDDYDEQPNADEEEFSESR